MVLSSSAASYEWTAGLNSADGSGGEGELDDDSDKEEGESGRDERSTRVDAAAWNR
jgi:hypothetical protein